MTTSATTPTPVSRKQLALSISPDRLAGSPACLNCGTELKGPFCYYCGQPDKNLVRFFPALIRDLLEDFLDFDSRFMRTMKPLLLHPGKLTRDFLDGRRFRYTPPLRLYIFSSMAFFIIAAMLTNASIGVNSGGDDADKSVIVSFGDDEADEMVKDLQQLADDGLLSEEYSAQISRAIEETKKEENSERSSRDAQQQSQSAAESDEVASEAEATEQALEDTENSFSFNDKPWDQETNPLIIPFMPDSFNRWLNQEISESEEKSRQIEENPNLIVDKFFDVLPITVFIMLPLVALLFKFWYLFSGRYYVEHLIHALHNHAFLFVVFTLEALIDGLSDWLKPNNDGLIMDTLNVVVVALAIWIPVYLLISLKTVYRQGWALTLAKFSVIGVSYLVLLITVASATAIAGFLLI